jgi:hypothetical protein
MKRQNTTKLQAMKNDSAIRMQAWESRWDSWEAYQHNGTNGK